MREGKRVVWIALGIFSLLSILIAHFFQIQIIDGKKWEEIGKRQHFFAIKEPFLRGTFWSNTDLRKTHPEKPQKLVLEIQKYHLYIDPLSIPRKNRTEIASLLRETIDLSPLENRALEGEFERQSRSRRIAMWLGSETKEKLLDLWNGYSHRNKIPRNALYFVPEFQRSYPFGKLLGQVLHTVQERRDEITKQAYPTGGLELYFDSFLRGRQGERLLKRSPRHSFETGQVISSPENGADIYLTINHCLQAIAEEEIERGVKRAQAKGGWAVMMEPKSGEILALAQYPFFYPAKYRDYFNNEDLIDVAKIKAITDAYEPGSVIKPFTALIALLANEELTARAKAPLFNPEDKMPCSNCIFPGRRKPLTDVTLHKFMNLDMATRKSSNIYFARLAEKIIERLGKEWYWNQLRERFEFGLKTHIELPSESPGVLPTPGKLHPNGALEWSVPTPFSLAIGYNLQLNSIQIAKGWCLLANGGVLVEPTLVRKIVKTNSDGKEEVLLDNTVPARIASFKQTVPKNIVDRVITAMKYTTKLGGSARRAEIWGYTEVGKSGTAHKIENGQYSQSKYLVSFAGIVPVQEPAFVLLVVVNEPKKGAIAGVNSHHGSGVAAPIFKAIATRSLEYLGVTPDDPHGYPPGDPRYDPNLAHWVPEAKKLQELYDAWNK